MSIARVTHVQTHTHVFQQLFGPLIFFFFLFFSGVTSIVRTRRRTVAYFKMTECLCLCVYVCRQLERLIRRHLVIQIKYFY